MVTAIVWAPSIAKAFNPTSFPLNGTSTLTFTLSNPNGGDGAGRSGVHRRPAHRPDGVGPQRAHRHLRRDGQRQRRRGHQLAHRRLGRRRRHLHRGGQRHRGPTWAPSPTPPGRSARPTGAQGTGPSAVLTGAAPVVDPPGVTTTTTTAPNPVPPFPRANVSYPNGAIVNFGGAHFVFAGGRAFAASAIVLAAVQKVDHAQCRPPLLGPPPRLCTPRARPTLFTGR